ncbi:hypothetical protein N9Y42_07140 [Mariniblastus sp.]|nr:hypothetical protein [Mariniblastus sp.]
MSKMTPKDYQDQIAILDNRIDKLTRPIPSRQVLQIAEAIRSAEFGDEDSEGSYSKGDYGNLLEAQAIVNDLLPPILENIRAQSIDRETGWRFVEVKAGNGDNDLCAICKRPFQHFGKTVQVHCIDMQPNAYHGVCRPCVRNYATLEFVESEGVIDWMQANRDVSPGTIEEDHKTECQRIDLIDAIRQHAHETHCASDICLNASEWAAGAFGEWR